MAVTENTYTGNGSTTNYSFTFPYLEETDVKVRLNGVLTTAYTFANATTIQFNTAPAAGVAIRIYRDTDIDSVSATFFAGSAIRAQDLNENFLQNNYTVQEIQDRYIDKNFGGTITGNVTIVGNTTLNGTVDINGDLDMNSNSVTNVDAPSAGGDATNKTYVDAQVALKVAKAGDTMSGNLAMSSNKVTGLAAPTDAADATNKTYVDAQVALKVSKSGDTMSGALNMGNNLITNLASPTVDTHAANKAYVDVRTGLYTIPGFTRWSYTATGGETVLSGSSGGITLGYSAGREQVFLNGAQLQRNVDYTADNGTSITVSVALIAGDVVEVQCVNNVITSDQSSALLFTQAGTGAVERTVESKLRDVVSVKDFGAVGDGVTDDTAAIQAAQTLASSNGKTLYFPDGVYYLGSGPLTLSVSCLFADNAIIDNETSAVTVTVNGLFTASRSLKFYRSTTRFNNQPVIYPEWIGVSPSNTASVNKTNWDRFIRYNYAQGLTTNNGIVELSSGSYPFEAPLYVPNQLRLFGKGLRHSTIAFEGSDNHAVEFCNISSGNAILTESSLTDSVSYVTLSGVYFNASLMTFTGGTKKAVCYAVTASSSFIEYCRFNSPTSETNQMDGILLVPATQGGGTSFIASQRSRVRYNRITNTRDAIVIGRNNASASVSEPSYGGSGAAGGGNSYEQEIHGNMIFGVQAGGATFKTLPRRGIVVQYHTTVDQEKPYNIEISRNTVILGYSDDNVPGTFGVTNGSTTVTYSGDLTSILPAIDVNNTRVLSLYINQGVGAVYNVQIASFVAGSLTLASPWPGVTAAAASAKIHSGTGIDVLSSGRGITAYNNFIDYGVHALRAGNNSSGLTLWGNQTQGTPARALLDASSVNSGNSLLHFHTAGGSTAYGPDNVYKGRSRSSTLLLGSDTAATSLTIASGAITPTESFHRVDTEGAAASDDLDTINGGENGRILVVTASNSARTVVIKNNTGNIWCGSDRSLDNGRDTATLIYDANVSRWILIAFSDNAP